jgi:hypothetical protein
VTYFRMLFCLEGMKKTTRKSHKYSAKTWIGNLLNICQQ